MVKINNFVKHCGGQIRPLLIDSALTKHTGIFNPSILVNPHSPNSLLINIRHCQYTILHAELQKYEHEFGPLVYLNPENDMTLTTTNYIGQYDLDMNKISHPARVDTSAHDAKKPLWTFVGLEDARLVHWSNNLYLTGVRRDTTTNGQGRMELSKVTLDADIIKETHRVRIPAPFPNTSYCEKNWMPILDRPYTYVKWTNPTEVVEYDPTENKTTTIYQTKKPFPFSHGDLRGGSQLIPYGNDYYIAVLHVTDLFKSEAGRKNGHYHHVFVAWNRHNFNIVKISPVFSFMGCMIEFCAGLAFHSDHFYLTFGVQDNAAYILKCDASTIMEFIFDNG